VNQTSFVVATAGHVDHGKSALVKALTGTDPDRLPEEKKRAITIELGFAHLQLPVDDDRKLSISIIDVPGHEDFVRNMIAGLGSIDLALLVVAADDGWMPQTEEHLQILTYLRVPRLLVAINKCDIASPNEAAGQVRRQLLTTGYADAAVIPVSARSGAGITDLKSALRTSLETTDPQPDIGKARLLIDRGFTLPGIGPVVTGTLSGGTITAGQPTYVQPENVETRVRSVQTHQADIGTARPGMRTGLNLAELPKSIRDVSGLRGAVLTTRRYENSSIIDVSLEKSPRPRNSDPAVRPIKSGAAVHLHYGTCRISATVVMQGCLPLESGQRTIAQLRLTHPIVAFAGDRFVVRDRSEQHTIAGGVILDPHAHARSLRNSARVALLDRRATFPHDARIFVESELIMRGPTFRNRLLPNSKFSDAEISSALMDLERGGRVVLHGEIAADIECWQKLRRQAADMIDQAHQTSSEQKGLDLTELRAALPHVSREAADALINDLCGTDFQKRGSFIARRSHRPSLPPELEAGAKTILETLAAKPLDPPARAQIAADSKLQQAARYLIQQGDVIELSRDVVVSRDAFDRAVVIVREFLQMKGSGTVSELREALHTSRRIAVPLLERLDRDRITHRAGDRRVLVQAAAPAVLPSAR
jgi:selenocysteine-specific elongation factor